MPCQPASERDQLVHGDGQRGEHGAGAAAADQPDDQRADPPDGHQHGDRLGHPGQRADLHAVRPDQRGHRHQRHYHLDAQRGAGSGRLYPHDRGDRLQPGCPGGPASERDQLVHGDGQRGEHGAGVAAPDQPDDQRADPPDGHQHGDRLGHPGQRPDLHAVRPDQRGHRHQRHYLLDAQRGAGSGRLYPHDRGDRLQPGCPGGPAS